MCVKPVTRTRKTRTREAGHGFSRVRVRVGEKNPGVARDNPYPQAHLHAQYRHQSRLQKCPHQKNWVRRPNRTEVKGTGAYVNFPQM